MEVPRIWHSEWSKFRINNTFSAYLLRTASPNYADGNYYFMNAAAHSTSFATLATFLPVISDDDVWWDETTILLFVPLQIQIENCWKTLIKNCLVWLCRRMPQRREKWGSFQCACGCVSHFSSTIFQFSILINGRRTSGITIKSLTAQSYEWRLQPLAILKTTVQMPPNWTLFSCGRHISVYRIWIYRFPIYRLNIVWEVLNVVSNSANQ